jgi:hypothetical protein
MDSIYPWLDAAAVHRLAERLMNPESQPSPTAADELTDLGPELPPAISNIPLPPGVSLFRDELRERYAAGEIFILDHQGSVIFDEKPPGRWHFLALQAARNSHLGGNDAGNYRLKIAAAAVLEIIPVSVADGGRVLGMVIPTALDATAVAAVREALRQMEIA